MYKLNAANLSSLRKNRYLVDGCEAKCRGVVGETCINALEREGIEPKRFWHAGITLPYNDKKRTLVIIPIHSNIMLGMKTDGSVRRERKPNYWQLTNNASTNS